MSQHSQHSQTNGASLEDCHTNFFALTDLCGIKWHVYTWECLADFDPLDDPVLLSYSRCLSANVLCVWRRSLQQQPPSGLDVPGVFHPPPVSNLQKHNIRQCPKELWVFWYGDEPDLSSLVAPELTKTDAVQGSWDWETGLSYEFRTILFKALHNLIERCLLSANFIRLGKWFVEPFDSSEPTNADNSRNTRHSVKLSFFVHGESTVCASVDVRNHPPVRKLTKKYIYDAQRSNHGLPVILAPYGMRGLLTGVTHKANERQALKLMEEWKRFFPLEASVTKDNELIAPVVEVIVGNFKMRYPTAYTLVTDMDTIGQTQSKQVDSSSNTEEDNNETVVTEGSENVSAFTASTHPLLMPGYLQKGGRGLGHSRDISERVWQEVVQCPGLQSALGGDTQDNSSPATQWNFGNPADKVNCHCTKCEPFKECELQVPFHRRPPRSPVPNQAYFHCDIPDAGVRAPPRLSGNTSSNTTNFGGYKGSIATPGSVPSVKMAGISEPPASVDSPASITRSPMPTPRTPHSQSNLAHQGESSMPTMSPMAPASNASAADPATPMHIDSVETKPLDQMGPKSTSSVHQGMSPYPGSIEGTPNKSMAEPVDAGSMQAENSNIEVQPQKKQRLQHNNTIIPFRKPILPVAEYHVIPDLSDTLPNITDVSKIITWLEHPIKRVRPSEPRLEEPMWPPYRPPHIAQKFQSFPRYDARDRVSEYEMILGRRKGLKRPADPYDFDDDVHDGHRVKEEKDDSRVKGSTDPLSPSKKAINLYTNEGLVPKASDLDELFDSPVDEYPVQTPPGSNKPLCNSEEISVSLVKLQAPLQKTTTSLELSQLAKMYPTPPSLEFHPEIECNLEDNGGIHGGVIIKGEIEDTHVHPDYLLREDVDDGSLVYKPSIVAPFIGSNRYKPLSELSSKDDEEIPIPSEELVYTPSWQSQPPEKVPPANHSTSQPGPPVLPHPYPIPLGPMSGPRGLDPISPAMDPKGPSSVGPTLPVNYELPSPASNHSYLNKTLPSVEPPVPPSLNVPEVNAILVNIVLQDSSINIFRDHNFESCTMCVCNNNNEKVVGNIRGSDGSLYLPPSQLSNEEEYIGCSCGFSAVVNRRLAYKSGLFYEDEVDLTGLHEGLMNEHKKSFQRLIESKGVELSERDIMNLDGVPQYIFDIVQSQSLVTLCTPSSVLHKVLATNEKAYDHFNQVEYTDGNEIAHIALEQARLDFNGTIPQDLENPLITCRPIMHKWTYVQFNGPLCSQDMIRCMKALQPYLQEAIQKKRSTRLWEPVYNVTGPLTWRQFHRMAVRGTEDMAEPLPIPLILAGHDKDWMSVAPQAVKHWEKLLLEPYSQPRDIAYIVVSPDNEYILTQVRSYFKELSSIYEHCKLGRHAPIRKVLRDGIMRVSKRAANKVANETLDQWFTLLGDSPMFTKLRIYAQVCCSILAPYLSTHTMDKSLFQPSSTRSTEQRQAPSPMPPPSSMGDTSNLNSNMSSTMSFGDDMQSSSPHVSGSTPVGFGPGSSLVEADEDDSPPPAIIVYLIDPFSVDESQPEMHRLMTMGLMRCYKAMLERLPESMQSQVHVQIVSIETILELSHKSHDRSKRIDQLKALAFSVFTQCRRVLSHGAGVRSLTGFGPASVFDYFLRPPKDILLERKNLNLYSVYSPPYILAPIKESKYRHKEAEEALGEPKEKSTVLYCTYCLSEDHRWLLGAVTDELGELLDTVIINTEVPNRTRRKKASSRRHGLKRLMEWLLGIMSIGVYPWRLVIGRMGRMGHGELKGWWSLLSRKNLALASKSLRDSCSQCSYLFPNEAPCILSACVVSLEPDSAFRMMPDMFTPDERFGQNSQNCNLSTPQDATCTHILVFPTSATAQSTRFQDDSTFNFDEGGELPFINEDDGIDGMGGGMSLFSDIFSDDTPVQQDMDALDDGSIAQDIMSQPGTPLGQMRTANNYSGQARRNGIVMADPQENNPGSGLQQQPLALGYYVSTASAGNLPNWFWSSCPHLENSCPTFFKSALHLNQPAVTQTEDFMHNASTRTHPLDSSCTADVLRYVLEGYNGLSWLIMDPTRQDRRSCLPLHMQVLCHLYHAVSGLL